MRELVLILNKDNIQVTFCLPSTFKMEEDLIKFNIITLDGLPFGLGFERELVISEGSRNSYLDNLIARITRRIIIDRKTKLNTIVSNLKPDLILIDSYISSDFILLNEYCRVNRVRVAFIQTMPSLRRCNQIPITSSRQPDKYLINKWEWLKYYVNIIIYKLTSKLVYLGNDNISQVLSEFKRASVNLKYSIKYVDRLQIVYNSIREFILIQSEFDFNEYPDQDQRYLGMKVDLTRQESEKQIELIDQFINNQIIGNKTIYISFGSLKSNKDRLLTSNLIDEIICIAERRNDLNFIVAGCMYVNVRPLPNILLIDQAPQLHVLRKSSIFISHGGLNSIKEAIMCGVPIISIPLTKGLDHSGNSSRIVNSGVGLVLNIKRTSLNQLEIMIDSLISKPYFKMNLLKFSERERVVYQQINILSEFNKLDYII